MRATILLLLLTFSVAHGQTAGSFQWRDADGQLSITPVSPLCDVRGFDPVNVESVDADGVL